MSIDVLDRCDMAPGDIVNFNLEDCGDFLAIVWAGGPAAHADGDHAMVIDAGLFGQVFDRQLVYCAEFRNRPGHFWKSSLRPNWR